MQQTTIEDIRSPIEEEHPDGCKCDACEDHTQEWEEYAEAIGLED